MADILDKVYSKLDINNGDLKRNDFRIEDFRFPKISVSGGKPQVATIPSFYTLDLRLNRALLQDPDSKSDFKGKEYTFVLFYKKEDYALASDKNKIDNRISSLYEVFNELHNEIKNIKNVDDPLFKVNIRKCNIDEIYKKEEDKSVYPNFRDLFSYVAKGKLLNYMWIRDKPFIFDKSFVYEPVKYLTPDDSKEFRFPIIIMYKLETPVLVYDGPMVWPVKYGIPYSEPGNKGVLKNVFKKYLSLYLADPFTYLEEEKSFNLCKSLWDEYLLTFESKGDSLEFLNKYNKFEDFTNLNSVLSSGYIPGEIVQKKKEKMKENLLGIPEKELKNNSLNEAKIKSGNAELDILKQKLNDLRNSGKKFSDPELKAVNSTIFEKETQIDKLKSGTFEELPYTIYSSKK